MSEFPIEVLNQVARAAAPLAPQDREQFIADCFDTLRLEPEVGPGTANRIIRELLRSELYRDYRD
jgi:hypothetical protein